MFGACGALLSPRIALTWFASYIFWGWKAGLSGDSLSIAVNFSPLFICLLLFVSAVTPLYFFLTTFVNNEWSFFSVHLCR